MRNKRIVIFFMACCVLVGSVYGTEVACKAAVAEAVMPRWISVSTAKATLNLSGNVATCQTQVTGYSNVKTIVGTMTLTLVKTDGTVKEIASWNLYGGQTLNERRSCSISESGIYQLSFSGTATMTNGSTENVTASETRMY